MKRYHSFPSTDVEPVVTPQEIADWTGADLADPLFGPLSIAATSTVIEFLQSELITRERTTVYETWPTVGTRQGAALSPSDEYLCRGVEVPYARFSTPLTLQVEASGTITTDYRVLERFPAELHFQTVPATQTDENPALKMVYNAGYGTIDDVPQTIKTAVLMITGYLYDHRGACTAEDALKKSGADVVLTPFKAKGVIL